MDYQICVVHSKSSSSAELAVSTRETNYRLQEECLYCALVRIEVVKLGQGNYAFEVCETRPQMHGFIS